MKKNSLIYYLLLLNLILPKLVLADEGLGTFEGIGGYQPDGDISDVNSYISPLEKLFSTIIGFLTILGGIWFFVQFLIGGLGWAGAGGDTQKVEEARKKMTNAAIGLIAMVAAYSVTYIIGKVLGLDILNLNVQIWELNPAGSPVG